LGDGSSVDQCDDRFFLLLLGTDGKHRRQTRQQEGERGRECAIREASE